MLAIDRRQAPYPFLDSASQSKGAVEKTGVCAFALLGGFGEVVPVAVHAATVALQP